MTSPYTDALHEYSVWSQMISLPPSIYIRVRYYAIQYSMILHSTETEMKSDFFSHKRHPSTHGRAMGVCYEDLRKKIDRVMMAQHCIENSNRVFTVHPCCILWRFHNCTHLSIGNWICSGTSIHRYLDTRSTTLDTVDRLTWCDAARSSNIVPLAK